MMKFILLLLIPAAFGGETYISVSYYDCLLGDKFRVEKVVSYINCEEKSAARKIIFDKTNELREIAIFGKDGKMIDESGANNNPALRAKVEAIFAAAYKGENPCLKKVPEKKEENNISSPSTSLQ